MIFDPSMGPVTRTLIALILLASVGTVLIAPWLFCLQGFLEWRDKRRYVASLPEHLQAHHVEGGDLSSLGYGVCFIICLLEAAFIVDWIFFT